MESQLTKIQIGIRNAVKFKKNKDMPSTPNTNVMPPTHPNFITDWNCPPPSKNTHKRTVPVKIANDQFNATSLNLSASFLPIEIKCDIPPKFNK